ncbi:MAG: Pyridoxine/pyridoxamine 5'-phosphate oxidase [Chlamydiae bacterium]|nr:Pyridoxine/pyridoxamine 5'-phosphate oxidase [Chlamydiota bacterium]
MIFDFSNYRRIFPKDFTYLSKDSLYSDPYDQCVAWFKEVLELQILDGNAMTLATANTTGVVSSRIVLLKYLDKRGFTFFTNYKSQKGLDIEENPQAALTFYWASLNRQLRVAGKILKVSLEESSTYFNSRPRSNQLQAHASNQDEEISSLQQIESKISELDKKFQNETIPLPEHWGGYRLIPSEFEFWQGGPSRINLRFQYSLKKDVWKIKQLAP